MVVSLLQACEHTCSVSALQEHKRPAGTLLTRRTIAGEELTHGLLAQQRREGTDGSRHAARWVAGAPQLRAEPIHERHERRLHSM